MALNLDDERKLRRNWSLLKQEIQVDIFVLKFVEEGIFSPSLRGEIMNVIPKTASMKAEKFLNAVIQSGNRGFDALCRFIKENPDNRYARLIEVLNIPRENVTSARNAITGNAGTSGVPNNGNAVSAQADSRPSTAVSSTSSGTINSETGEKHRRVRTVPAVEHPQPSSGCAPVAAVAPQVNFPARQPLPSYQRRSSSGEIPVSTTPQALFVESRIGESFIGSSRDSEISIASYNSNTSDDSNSATTTPQASTSSQRGASVSGNDAPVDMKVLEQELVRIAPTIADLFKKISVQTSSSIPTTEEELQKVKDENERLRKTNKSLIEKLNAFQQKIIQLQLDNKKLKENGDAGRVKNDAIKQKAAELQAMEKRLDEHKKALEEKGRELNIQLEKLREIEEENEEQRQKIDKLEELQDEGIMERNMQQEQISILVEEKERQKDQIESLEEQQKIGEHRLFSLEERLKLLEQGPKQRQGRNRRVMSPPRNNYWMNGIMDRSHHANVKFQSEIKFDPNRNGKRNGSTGKAGWPFI